MAQVLLSAEKMHLPFMGWFVLSRCYLCHSQGDFLAAWL